MATTPRIGTMIRRARERQLMSQEELAAKLHVSRSAVNAWERDRSYPRNRIGALEDILGISLDSTAGDGELVPQNAWERATLADPDLPDDVKRAFVLDWRAARAAYKRQSAQQEAAQPREAGQSAARQRADG